MWTEDYSIGRGLGWPGEVTQVCSPGRGLSFSTSKWSRRHAGRGWTPMAWGGCVSAAEAGRRTCQCAPDPSSQTGKSRQGLESPEGGVGGERAEPAETLVRMKPVGGCESDTDEHRVRVEPATLDAGSSWRLGQHDGFEGRSGIRTQRFPRGCCQRLCLQSGHPGGEPASVYLPGTPRAFHTLQAPPTTSPSWVTGSAWWNVRSPHLLVSWV